MSFGGFLDNNWGGSGGGAGGGARIVADIPYSNGGSNENRMATSLVTAPTMAKSMFNSPGLSLALVRSLYI